MSAFVSLLQQGRTCATCAFSHHWEEERQFPVKVKERTFWRPGVWKTEPMIVNGIQCLRYPKPMDTDADHGCGEYVEAPATPDNKEQDNG